MKVIFAVPAYDGKISIPTAVSLNVTLSLLKDIGIENDIMYLAGSCYISAARNQLVADFLKTDGTDLFFIDADVGFPAEAVLKLLKQREDIVGGVYPLKKHDEEAYPVVIKTNEDGIPMGRDGLIEATGLPTGFMRIKRHVLEKMCDFYKDLEYKENNETRYDLFGCEVAEGRWWGDDLNFCRRWVNMGGQMWVVPDIDFSHVGGKMFKGNYHKYLLNRPKS